MAKPYPHQKGANFEREIAKDLTLLFKQWGFKFVRTGSQERFKSRSGDVNLLEWTDPKQLCVFRRIHIEAECRDNPSFLPKLQKAKDDADPGKLAIYVAKKTRRVNKFGKMIEYPTFVMMTWEDFKKLILETNPIAPV